MLKINHEQMKAFEDISLRSFEDEMLLHCKAFSPLLCENISDDQLDRHIRDVIIRAKTYDFTNRGSIRLFLELVTLLGNGFDKDPQYPEIGNILNSSDSQILRTEHIYKWATEYFENVATKENKIQALNNVSLYLNSSMSVNRNSFYDEMIGVLQRLFPEKANHLGKEQLMLLINQSKAEITEYDLFVPTGIEILITLKFIFGHACTSDPYYPWIINTLTDKECVNSEALVKALNVNALAWLEKTKQATKR